MEKLKIKSGGKVELVLGGGDKKPFEVKSTFEKNVNEASFLISVPMSQGKRLEADPFQKLLIKYELGGGVYVVEGYVDDVAQEGRRTFWKIRKVSENREFFQRTDERIKVNLEITFTKRWWTPEGLDSAEELNAITMDVSAGGLAMLMNAPLAVGEIVEVGLPSVKRKRGVSLSGETCWFRETEKGNAFRYMAGLKFVFITPKDKDRMYKYIEAVAEEKGALR